MNITVKTIKNDFNENKNLNLCIFDFDNPIDEKALAYACLTVLERPMVSFDNYYYGLPYMYYSKLGKEAKEIPQSFDAFCAETDDEFLLIHDGVSMILHRKNPLYTNEVYVEYKGDLSKIKGSFYNNIERVENVYNSICRDMDDKNTGVQISILGVDFVECEAKRKNIYKKPCVEYYGNAQGLSKQGILEAILNNPEFADYEITACNDFERYFDFRGLISSFENEDFGNMVCDTAFIHDNGFNLFISVKEDFVPDNIYMKIPLDMKEEFIKALKE